MPAHPTAGRLRTRDMHDARLARLLERMGDPLEVEAFDWASGPEQVLTDAEVFQLTYAAQVEWGTEGTFLSLDTTDDPLVCRFLRTWLEQEVVHAELLVRLLEATGHSVEPIHRRADQRRAARRGRLVNRAARAALGEDFTAVHMAWGAVNELTTLRFYGLIRDRTASPLLERILADVMAQEALHYAFYRQAASVLLEDNPRGQRLVRLVLRRLWSPVGVGLRSHQDAERLLHDLFDPSPGTVGRIDASVGAIPGLRGLDLVSGYMAGTASAA